MSDAATPTQDLVSITNSINSTDKKTKKKQDGAASKPPPKTPSKVSGRNFQALELPLADLVTDPRNCGRGQDSDDDQRALTDSIRTRGVIQPIVVTARTDGKYLVIAGSRRVAASRSAGLTVIPAVVRSDRSAVVVLAVRGAENFHRTNLRPWQAAALCTQLLRECRSQREVAAALGISPSLTSRFLTVSAAITRVSGSEIWATIGTLPSHLSTVTELATSIDSAYAWAQQVLHPLEDEPEPGSGHADEQTSTELTPAQLAQVIAALSAANPSAASIDAALDKGGELTVSMSFSSLSAALREGGKP